MHTSRLILFPKFPLLTHFLHDLFFLNYFLASSFLLSPYAHFLHSSWVGVGDVAFVSSPQRQPMLQGHRLVVFPSLFNGHKRFPSANSLSLSLCTVSVCVDTPTQVSWRDTQLGSALLASFFFHRSNTVSSLPVTERTKRKNNEHCPAKKETDGS